MRGRRVHRGRRLLAALVGVVTLVAVGAACEPPARLAVTPVWSGLNRPWDLAFAPGGEMLFTQRSGEVRVGLYNGQLRTLADPPDVVSQGEGGMLGLAIDPGFSSNRLIYTCFLSNASGALDVRLVRWRVNSGFTALEARADIVTGMPVNTNGQAGRHSGCRPRFGPDGYLWVTTGDAAMPTVPQDSASLGGKVLRVDRNGAPAPGNAGGPFDARIYTYGHRNPQGISWRPSDGTPFVVEHGTGCDDEVNQLIRGRNYGWDPRPLSGPLFYDESRPMTDQGRHPGSVNPVWRSGCPTIAPSGSTFLDGPQWGLWGNGLAMAVLKDQHLRIMKLDGPYNTASAEWVRVTDRGRLRVAVQGPDGNLYLLTDSSSGQILRVVPS